MTWILTWLAVLLFTWQAKELTEFKQIAYEFNSTLSWESIYDTKKCKTELSAIAYAFAMKETGNWKWLKQQNKNNLFWLRRWTSKTTLRPIFASYPVKTYTPNGYNIYKSRHDSIYDFMNKFYYKWCKLTYWYVKSHLNWPNWWDKWVQKYLDSLQYHIKYYNSLKFRVKLIK